jgi:hypothetical protein
MLGINQFQRADNGQRVLKMGSEFRVWGPDLRLIDQMKDWLEEVYGGDELMWPGGIMW